MPAPVQLSVILTTHTDRSHFDSLLLTLTRMSHPGLELIVLNDAAGAELSESIQKVLESCTNDHIYYFDHETPKGRGSCLNEGVSQAVGTLLWAPLKAERLNESLITDFIRRFRSEPAAFWTLDYSLPKKTAAWAELAADGNLPDDSCLVWNRSVIKSKDLFFNPYMENLHGAELALRLCEDYTWHKTDPFFVLSDKQAIFGSDADSREFLMTALRLDPDTESRKEIIGKLEKLEAGGVEISGDEQLLIEARRLLNDGDASKALELINRYLRKHPDHYEANRIKITSLEKQRRHVEAAELKHMLQKKRIQAELSIPEEEEEGHENVTAGSEADSESKPEPEPDQTAVQEDHQAEEEVDEAREHGRKTGPLPQESNVKSSGEIDISVIIPTAAAGRQLLEGVLLRLEEIADPAATELIIIDNASIDDTFEYLQQLKQDRFFNLKLITNRTNRGFAASLNRGMDVATGKFLLIMHNDVILGTGTMEALAGAFRHQDNLGMAVPVLNASDVAEQVAQQGETARYIPLTTADSCCFMVRKYPGIEFDDEYRLCHFEMQDFCMQLRRKGQNIVAVSSAHAEHHPAQTTSMMGTKLTPHLKWANRDRFHKKWGTPPAYEIPAQGSHPDRLQKLGVPDDPLNPDMKWVDAIQKYLNSEVRTEILRTKWSPGDLITIVTAMLIADERELLRTLEDRIDELELPVPLLILFIEYYFSKNIYSRCRHYLEKGGNRHPSFDLYRLKILVAEKETDRATPILTELLENYPASPDLLHLAGDIYRQSGDEDEAKSFYALASQVDPFRFSNEEVEFEI
jgi:glycosyltransferase involved in cell wall biosynthesis